MINLLRTYHFCNVVHDLDFLSYCSTYEYAEELGRLIRLKNAIQVSIAPFLTFNLCEQGLTIHSSVQFPRMQRSIQRQSLAHNEGKRSLSRLVVPVETSQFWPSVLFFTAIALYSIAKTGLSWSTLIGNGFHVCSWRGQEVKCYAQQIIFLIFSAHSIPFSQWKNSYFPLLPEPLVRYKLNQVALRTRMAGTVQALRYKMLV